MSVTSLAFLLIFVSGVLLATFRHPFFGLLTYMAVFYLSPADRWWGEGWMVNVRWSFLAAGITLLSMLIHRQKLQPATFWRRGPMVGMLIFIAWLAIQLAWASMPEEQTELLTMYLKFIIVMFMIFRCIDSIGKLKSFLWVHVLGCLYLGFIAFTTYTGGRFEGFGGPGIGEANAGALALATGVLTAAGLFMAGRVKEKVAVTLAVPIILNGVVTTVSRSGFLAIAVGGLIFNVIAPKRYRLRVNVLSALGVVLMLLVTNPAYWARIASIKYAGQEMEEVDTGEDRIETVRAQWQMFLDHPMGCGHRCTALLSVGYLDDRFLTGEGENRGRSSHNTFMSLMVEQGILGGLFYVVMLIWLSRALLSLLRHHRKMDSEEANLFPSVVAALAAITLGDQFVDYLKFEPRIWFVTLIMLAMYTERFKGSKTPSAGDEVAQRGRPLQGPAV